MENKSKVFLNPDGFIEVIVAPMLDAMSQNDLQVRAYYLAQELEEGGMARKILADISKLESMNEQAQALAVRGINGLEFEKVAAYGGTPEIEQLVSRVFAQSNKPDTLRLFRTREEATSWLSGSSDK